MKPQNSEMHVLLMNRRVLHFTPHEIRALYGSNQLRGFILVMWLLLITIDPYFFTSIPTFSSRAFYWGAMMIIYTFVFPQYIVWVCHFWGKVFSFPIPHPLISMPLIFVLTWLSTILPTIFGDWVPPRYGDFNLFLWLRNWTITVLLEAAGIFVFWPRSKEDFALVPKEEVQASATVSLAGMILPLRSIIYVKSEGHYLEIQETTGQKVIRARMKDLLVQLDEADGVSPHRSYWINREHITEIRKSDIATTTGESFPISRGKAKEIQEWGRKHIS